MAGPYVYDRVLETTTTTGTGTLTLAGAVTGYQSFGAVGNTNTCMFTTYEVDADGNADGDWEVAEGAYTLSGTTLARTTILASSNAGAAVNFAAGTKRVALVVPGAFASRFLHPTAAYSSLAAYQAGRVAFPSDGLSVLRDTGSALAPWGPIWPLTDPTAQSFAWINQGGATVASGKGAIFLQSATVADEVRVQKKAAPSTPYTITAAFIPLYQNIAVPNCGLCHRQSSDGKLTLLRYIATNNGSYAPVACDVSNYTGPSAGYSATPAATPLLFTGGLVWQRIGDNGTNRTYDVSFDGVNWSNLYTVTRTTFLTADEVGFYLNNANGGFALPASVSLVSWKEG
jgi:hypothetical protein